MDPGGENTRRAKIFGRRAKYRVFIAAKRQ
jgi:hypothetical protein